MTMAMVLTEYRRDAGGRLRARTIRLPGRPIRGAAAGAWKALQATYRAKTRRP